MHPFIPREQIKLLTHKSHNMTKTLTTMRCHFTLTVPHSHSSAKPWPFPITDSRHNRIAHNDLVNCQNDDKKPNTDASFPYLFV